MRDAVVVSFDTSGMPLAQHISNSDGWVPIALTSDIRRFDIGSEQGSATIDAASVANGFLRVTGACEVVDGDAHGAAPPGGVVWAHAMTTNTYYGALIREDGTFGVCVPGALYSVEADSPSISIATLVEAPGSVELYAYTKEQIDAPPPNVEIRGAPSLLELVPPDADVVAIGEPNHGARETLRLRVSGCLDLTSRGKPVAVALEAGEAEVRPVNEFVQGAGTEAQVRASVSRLGYWIWDTEEFIAELVELRDYNRRALPERRVSLHGIDVQIATRGAFQIQRLANERRWPADKTLSAVAAGVTLDKVEARYRERTKRWLNDYPMARGDISARLMAASLIAQIDSAGKTGLGKQMARDREMATLVSLLDRGWDGAVCVLAHNDHIDFDRGDWVPAMGVYLRAELGESYFSVGLLAGAGKVRAWDPKSEVGVIVHAVSPPQGSFEAYLDEKHVAGYVAMDAVGATLKEWLAAPHVSFEFGATMLADPRSRFRRLGRSFDAVRLVPVLSPTTPTATGERRATAR